jgi:hypothetical protein
MCKPGSGHVALRSSRAIRRHSRTLAAQRHRMWHPDPGSTCLACSRAQGTAVGRAPSSRVTAQRRFRFVEMESRADAGAELETSGGEL